jgi:capsular exopolysaccharide synthesis family protein
VKSAVLELRATGPSREATQAFLDAVMEEYIAFKNDSRKRTSSGALSGITEQIREVERQIQQQQDQMTLFQVSNNISYLTEHGLSAGSHLSKLGELLSDLRTEQRLLELLSPAQFKGLAEGPQAAVSELAVPGDKAARARPVNGSAPETAYYQALQQSQILKAKRDEFSRVLRPTHSKMVKLNQEIAGLEQLLKILRDEGEQRVLVQMADRKKALELQIENLENQYRAWETNSAEASRKLAEYDRMKQDMQRSQSLYDRLLGLMQTVDLNNNLDQESLVPMAPASTARPTFARYGIAAAGLFLACLVGLGAFLVLDFLDDRFNSARELSLNLAAEVVGQIPNACLDRGQRLLPVNGAFIESFRNLRTSLLCMSGQEPRPKVILVTSAVPEEGKTTVASNLAKTLAQAGFQVLLIDADYHHASVHKIFHVGGSPGLLEVLEEGVAPAQAIVGTAEPNLYVLPAGTDCESSSDVLLRCRADLLLKSLAGQFDYILVDSAPVLAMDDATCLGSFCDGVFLVVRAAHTSSRMAGDALDRLLKRNLKILGMIYNRAPVQFDYYSRYTADYHRNGGSARRRAPASTVSGHEVD